MSQVSDLLNKIALVQYQPTAVQDVLVDNLRDMMGDKVMLSDPSNPFVVALDWMTLLATNIINANEALDRKHYPLLANTASDIYRHMTDTDYIGMFATPSKAVFGIGYSKDEIEEKMVLDPETGNRKLVIPRNTSIKVADITFGLHYPIEIRQAAHGGLSVVYNVEKASPLQTLETNDIPWKLVPNGGINWLMFEVELQQFSVISKTSPISQSAIFKTSMPITDKYYYARVWREVFDANNNRSMVEMDTTHSDQIYNIAKPTAVLTVYDNELEVSIPSIYQTQGVLNRTSNIRVDLYETKGALNVDLGPYPVNGFTATYTSLDKSEATAFTAPMPNMRAVQFFSESRTAGGVDAPSFADLRTQVINGLTGPRSVPIVPTQISAGLQKLGYSIVTNVDNVTNRVLLATKQLPAPSNPRLITPAACSIEMLGITTNQLVQLDTVIDNGSSVTITPDTVYQSVRGIIRPVSSAALVQLLQLPPDKRAIAVTNGLYFYSPFHYVLEQTDTEFAVRPYYLAEPAAKTKAFVAENDTTLLGVSVATDSYILEKSRGGYTLTITTKSTASFQSLPDSSIYVQMAYKPQGEKDYAYLNGTLVGKDPNTNERVYQFFIGTNYDINSSHYLQLTDFLMYNFEPRKTGAALLQDFELFFITDQVMPTTWAPNSIDQLLGRFLLPERIAGLSHERLTLYFGQSLDRLWAQARSVIDSVSYLKYETDIPRYWPMDVYKQWEDGSKVKIVDGKAYTEIEYHAGDPMVDDDGNIVYEHHKGDVIYDANGRPTPVSNREMLHQLDLLLIEGVYWFSTDITGVNYRKEMANTFAQWLRTDLAEIQKVCLEETHIYYYPQATLGEADVMVLNGQITKINTAQSFTVDLTIPERVDKNTDIKEAIRLATIDVLSKHLAQVTVSNSAIIHELRNRYGEDVIDVQVKGLGGSANFSTIQIQDQTRRFSLQKRLVAQPDDTLMVEENITFNWIRYARPE